MIKRIQRKFFYSDNGLAKAIFANGICSQHIDLLEEHFAKPEERVGVIHGAAQKVYGQFAPKHTIECAMCKLDMDFFTKKE